MKVVTKYIAEDGIEFFDKEECVTHENGVRNILEEINELQDNPSEALVALMTGIQDRLNIKLVYYEDYVKLFRCHKPCARQCTLWKVLSDYNYKYPTIYAAYIKLIDDYTTLYGEDK